jgi:hypothetical protein
MGFIVKIRQNEVTVFKKRLGGKTAVLCCAVAHFVPSCGTFCAVLWHILCRGRPVAIKSKSIFVPCCGT